MFLSFCVMIVFITIIRAFHMNVKTHFRTFRRGNYRSVDDLDGGSAQSVLFLFFFSVSFSLFSRSFILKSVSLKWGLKEYIEFLTYVMVQMK